MPLSNAEQEFPKQHGSGAMLPRPWQQPFRQTAYSNVQELQPRPFGEHMPSKMEEAVGAKISNRRRRQRERRALRSKFKQNQELEQEMNIQELGWDQFSKESANEIRYGQSPREDQGPEPQANINMPIETFNDVYYP